MKRKIKVLFLLLLAISTFLSFTIQSLVYAVEEGEQAESGGGGDGGVAHAACGHGTIAIHRGHRAVGTGPAHAGILLIGAAHAQGRGRVLVAAAHGQGHGALAQVHSGEEGVLILHGFRSHSGVSRGSLRLRALRISRRGAQEHHAERCRSNAVFQYIFQFHR